MSSTHIFEPDIASGTVSQVMQINAAISEMIGVNVASNLDLLVRAQEPGISPKMVIVYLESRKLNRASLDWVINSRTLKRRIKNHELLNLSESDRFIRVVRLTALAETVFGNKEAAQSFLTKSRLIWNGKSGSELIQTDNGGRIVEELLQNMNHGLFT